MMKCCSLVWLVLLTTVFATSFAFATTTRAASQADDPYVGNQMCVRCHEDVQTTLIELPHGRGDAPELVDNGCQSCHGPGRAHVQRPDDAERQPSLLRMNVSEQNQLCTGCHVDMSPFDRSHARDDISCSSCHTLHVRDPSVGILSWQRHCIACHAGNAGYDELHEYDREAMAAGTVSCRSCHQRPAHAQ